MLLRCAALVLLAAPSFAQIDEEAGKLLRDVEAAARTTANWRAEGTQSVDEDLGRGFRHHTQTHFTFDVAAGSRVRLLVDENGVAQTVVCDGSNAWSHFGRATLYTKTPVAFAGSLCAQQQLQWQTLTFRLQSARTAGAGDGCQNVRAEYPSSLGGNSPDVRVLCIDPAAKIVRTDRLEAQGGTRKLTRITTVSSFERDPQPRPDTFTFQPPPKTELADNSDLPNMGRASGPIYRVGRDVTAPQIVSRHEPEYTEEARRVKYNAVVMLWLIVGTDGVPEDIRVIRSVGMGLDDRAVEAVRGWRFRPATKDGQPVRVLANIEVSFRIL